VLLDLFRVYSVFSRFTLQEVHLKCNATILAATYSQLAAAVLAAVQAQQAIKPKGVIYVPKDEFTRMGMHFMANLYCFQL
jgi:hypothetical protein